MWVHVTGLERPSWMSGHLPPTTYLAPGHWVQGTRDAASRALEQLHHLDVGRATGMAGEYARRRPMMTAGSATFLAFLFGIVFGWVAKSLTCRGQHIDELNPPVVEYFSSGPGPSGGAPSVDE
jgi:hypothetical protein